MDLRTLTVAHNERLAALDDRLPASPPLDPDSGQLLQAQAGGSAAAGVVRSDEVDPHTMVATWRPLRVHRLDMRLAGHDPVAAMEMLLERWDDCLAGVRLGPDNAATLIAPSRDPVPPKGLIRHGFTPTVTLAERPVEHTASYRTGTATTPAAPGVHIRRGSPDDLEELVGLRLELIRYDQLFDTVAERPSTTEGLRRELREQLTVTLPSLWVAERDGETVGLAELQLPPDSDWIGGLVTGTAAYLATMYVSPDARGTGLGNALLASVHAACVAAGVERLLLHHAIINPLSTPFWHAHGFRPLWTAWRRCRD